MFHRRILVVWHLNWTNIRENENACCILICMNKQWCDTLNDGHHFLIWVTTFNVMYSIEVHRLATDLCQTAGIVPFLKTSSSMYVDFYMIEILESLNLRHWNFSNFSKFWSINVPREFVTLHFHSMTVHCHSVTVHCHWWTTILHAAHVYFIIFYVFQNRCLTLSTFHHYKCRHFLIFRCISKGVSENLVSFLTGNWEWTFA